MRPRVVTLGMLILALLVAFVPGCGGDKSNNPVVPPTLELDSPTLNQNGTYMHTFANAGTYNYHCKFHGGMNGTVTVASAQPASASVSISGNSFGAPVSVQPGGTVTWTNMDAAQHSVTSN